MAGLIPEDILIAYQTVGVPVQLSVWVQWIGFTGDICTGCHPAYIQVMDKLGGEQIRASRGREIMLITAEQKITPNYIEGFNRGVADYRTYYETDDDYVRGIKAGTATRTLLIEHKLLGGRR